MSGSDEMILIEGGTFQMGSDNFYPEEAPTRKVRVRSFWIDRTPVTNREFARFVAETGYRTKAEIAPDPKDYPGMDPEMAKPGSLVFRRPSAPIGTGDWGQWWEFCFGADWRHPYGPDSSLDGLEDHPVVHIAHEDAAAYAKWAKKRLLTEAEWEYAASGGAPAGQAYAWGDELAPQGRMMANFWQGQFPHENTMDDGWERTSPVGTFPANGFGLSDMIGNVWEWTSDWYAMPQVETKKRSGSCCAIDNPRGAKWRESLDPAMPELRIGRKVIKGGSHLCAENYCQRYRPAARHPQATDSSTSHIGFRCARDA